MVLAAVGAADDQDRRRGFGFEACLHPLNYDRAKLTAHVVHVAALIGTRHWATYPQPAMPTCTTDERLSFAADQFTGSGQPDLLSRGE